MARHLETGQNSLALIPLEITSAITIETELLEETSKGSFKVIRNEDVQDKPEYTILYKDAQVGVVRGFIMDGVAQVGILDGTKQVFHVTNWTKLVKLLITRFVLGKELEQAENRHDGLTTTRLQLQLAQLNQNIDTFENLPTVALFSPIASYKIEDGLIIGAYSILKSFGVTKYTGNFPLYSLEGLNITGEQADVIKNSIKTSPVFTTYNNLHEEVFAIPGTLTLTLKTKMLTRIVNYRKQLEMVIADLYKADVYPPAIAIDEADNIDSHLRSRLYELSKATRDKNLKLDVQFTSILNILTTDVGKAIVSRLIYPVTNKTNNFVNYDKMKPLISFITASGINTKTALIEKLKELNIETDGDLIPSGSMNEEAIIIVQNEMLDFITVSVLLLDNQPITELSENTSYVIEPYSSTLLQFISGIARYNKYSVVTADE